MIGDGSQGPHVRVGIETGLVVVGDPTGDGGTEERAVVGETANLAARLQALAEPDNMVIGPSTRRRMGGLLRADDARHDSAQGLREPIRAWRATGERRVADRFEAFHATNLTPIRPRPRR